MPAGAAYRAKWQITAQAPAGTIRYRGRLMEGIFFALIGAALFSQSWHVLGLYAEGRMMAIFTGGLGLLGLIALWQTPQLLTGDGTGADMVAETTILKMVIIIWAAYAVGVAANGLWDFDERAIGFYGIFLAAGTAVSFIYYAVELEVPYSNSAWLGMSGATLALTAVATIMFFYQAFGFHVLRLVTGWSLLIGGSVVGLVGLGVIGTVIT